MDPAAPPGSAIATIAAAPSATPTARRASGFSRPSASAIGSTNIGTMAMMIERTPAGSSAAVR